MGLVAMSISFACVRHPLLIVSGSIPSRSQLLQRQAYIRCNLVNTSIISGMSVRTLFSHFFTTRPFIPPFGHFSGTCATISSGTNIYLVFYARGVLCNFGKVIASGFFFRFFLNAFCDYGPRSSTFNVILTRELVRNADLDKSGKKLIQSGKTY